MPIAITEDDRIDISSSSSEGGAKKNRGLALKQATWHGTEIIAEVAAEDSTSPGSYP